MLDSQSSQPREMDVVSFYDFFKSQMKQDTLIFTLTNMKNTKVWTNHPCIKMVQHLFPRKSFKDLCENIHFLEAIFLALRDKNEEVHILTKNDPPLDEEFRVFWRRLVTSEKVGIKGCLGNPLACDVGIYVQTREFTSLLESMNHSDRAFYQRSPGKILEWADNDRPNRCVLITSIEQFRRVNSQNVGDFIPDIVLTDNELIEARKPDIGVNFAMDDSKDVGNYTE